MCSFGECGRCEDERSPCFTEGELRMEEFGVRIPQRGLRISSLRVSADVLRQSADGFWVGIFGSRPRISRGELNVGAVGLRFFEPRLSFLWLGLRISCHGH